MGSVGSTTVCITSTKMHLYFCILAFTAVAMAADPEAELFKQGSDIFTARMFSEVVKKNPGKSVVLSALSVLPPLGQLAIASEGDSHDEILRAIGLPNNDVTKSVFSNTFKKLRSIKGVELKMANRIYIAEDAELNNDFAALSKEVFESDVKNVDFVQRKETANEINTWVEDQTNHKIKDLIDPTSLSRDTRAILVNAIYFKGSWINKFDKQLTSDRDFHVSKDKTIKVPTMFTRGEFRYGESEALDAKLLEMPYEGYDSSLIIVVPNNIEGITEVESKISDPLVLENAVKAMSTFEVDVALPKFKIETTTDLIEILGKINVTKLFSQTEAKLTNLLKDEGSLYISEAVQKAFIDVNEEGAEAAATNEFGVSYLAAFEYDKRDFIADRPFVFLLRKEKITLFSGVYQP